MPRQDSLAAEFELKWTFFLVPCLLELCEAAHMLDIDCVDIVEDRRQERSLWKSHCQLLGRGDTVSKLHGDLSFLVSAASHLVSVKPAPYCTRSSSST